MYYAIGASVSSLHREPTDSNTLGAIYSARQIILFYGQLWGAVCAKTSKYVIFIYVSLFLHMWGDTFINSSIHL